MRCKFGFISLDASISSVPLPRSLPENQHISFSRVGGGYRWRGGHRNLSLLPWPSLIEEDGIMVRLERPDFSPLVAVLLASAPRQGCNRDDGSCAALQGSSANLPDIVQAGFSGLVYAYVSSSSPHCVHASTRSRANSSRYGPGLHRSMRPYTASGLRGCSRFRLITRHQAAANTARLHDVVRALFKVQYQYVLEVPPVPPAPVG